MRIAGLFTVDLKISLVLSQFYKGLFRILQVFTLQSVTGINFMTSLCIHISYSMQNKILINVDLCYY